MKYGKLFALFVLPMLFLAGCTSETNYVPSSSNESQKVASEKIRILDHQMTYNDFGNLIVTGTAENVAGKNLSYVEIKVKFYDKGGVLLNTFLDNINDVASGQKWKFEVMYPRLDVENVDHYDIGVGTVF